MTTHFRLLILAGMLTAPVLGRAQSISGTLFEDVNYGGGAGRSLAAANAVRAGSAVPLTTAATVELYDAVGNYLATTTTSTAVGSLGQYAFASLAAGTYQVRVVSSTVRSTRAGSTSALVPVQTFVVRNGVADAARVGGENPAQADGPANGASGALLRFQGLSTSGDNTAFVDQVEVRNSANAVVTGAVPNNSFETPDLGNASNSFTYNISGGQWDFTGASGIAANGSAFNSTAPAGGGDQVAFIQNQGAPQQTLTLAPGTYTIRFQATQRTTNSQSVQVLVNGTEVLRVTPSQGAYTTYTTGSFTVGGVNSLASLTPHSLAPVTVAGGAAVTGVDFGFNFDLITNVNDAGQGSLRQFILNANALDNTTLRQLGRAPRRETSLFMISDGQAHPGLRAGLADQLTGAAGQRVALYSPATVLPTISGSGTVLDATTQTNLVGNSNTVLLGTGGTVGTDALPLSQVNGPEVELAVTLPAVTGLIITADSCTLRGLALHGGTTSLQLGGNGALLEGNALGITATAVGLPATARTSGAILTLAAPTAVVQNNLIGYAGNSGLRYSVGRTTTGAVIRNNEFVQNGQITAGGDALSIGDGGAAGPLLIEGNLISLSNSSGIQLEIGSISNNIIRNNTISGNGTGGTNSRLEGSGIHYLARTGTVNSTNTDLISRNLVTRNQSSGIVLNYGQRNVQISQNSVFLNGDGTIAGAAGLLSIDFTGPNGRVGGDSNYGQGDGVTGNDGLLDVPGTPTSQIPPYRQANGGIDYPVITNISRDANNRLRVQGYVGSAAGQPQFGGATVEIYSANNTDTNQNGPVVAGDGQLVAHGEAQFYVGTITAAANGTFDATLATVARNIQPGDIITATAYLPGYGTSECGVNQISTFQVLPVQLTQFTAVAQQHQVLLRWSTAAELQNNRFEVERATDGRTFRQVGQVAGLGTSSQGQAYRFLDTPPTAPTLYYRLRQVDHDGTAAYSAVQTVRLTAPVAEVVLSPNPATSDVTVNLTALPTGTYTLTLRDVQGRTVLHRTANGTTSLALPLQTLPAGVYYLTVQGQQQLLTRRVLKH